MARWDTIFDPTNPFNRSGLSDEVEAMLDYLVDAKADTEIDVVATSTTDHPLYSASGSISRHRQPGTNGEGLGLDCRLRKRGKNIHLPVWKLLLPVARRCHELIYAQGIDEQGRPRNIKNEAWVNRYAVSSHYDHVHISVDKGVILKYPVPSVPTPSNPAPEPVVYNHPEDNMQSKIIHIELDANGRGNEPTGVPKGKLSSLEVFAGVVPNVNGWYPGDPGRTKPECWPTIENEQITAIVIGGDPNWGLDVLVSYHL